MNEFIINITKATPEITVEIVDSIAVSIDILDGPEIVTEIVATGPKGKDGEVGKNGKDGKDGITAESISNTEIEQLLNLFV